MQKTTHEQVFLNTNLIFILEIGGQRLSSSPGVLRRHVPALQNSGPDSAPSSPKLQHAWSPSNRSSAPGTPTRRDSTDAIGMCAAGR